jgi:hypothetical protein
MHIKHCWHLVKIEEVCYNHKQFGWKRHHFILTHKCCKCDKINSYWTFDVPSSIHSKNFKLISSDNTGRIWERIINA